MDIQNVAPAKVVFKSSPLKQSQPSDNQKTPQEIQDGKKKLKYAAIGLAVLGIAAMGIAAARKGKKPAEDVSKPIEQVQEILGQTPAEKPTQTVAQQATDALGQEQQKLQDALERKMGKRALEAATGKKANKSAQESAQVFMEQFKKEDAIEEARGLEVLNGVTGKKANKSAQESAIFMDELLSQQENDRFFELATGVKSGKKAIDSAALFEENRPGNIAERIGDITAQNDYKFYVNPKIEAEYKKMKPETISSLSSDFIQDTISRKGKSKELIKNLGKLEKEFSQADLAEISKSEDGTKMLLDWVRGNYNSQKQYEELTQWLHAFSK